MICYICAKPAAGQCKECLRFYCREHGDVVCEACASKSRDSGHSLSDDRLGSVASRRGTSLANTARRTGCILGSVYLGRYMLPIIGFAVLLAGFALLMEVGKLRSNLREPILRERFRANEEMAWVNALLWPSLPSERSVSDDTNWEWMVFRVEQLHEGLLNSAETGQRPEVLEGYAEDWEDLLLARENALRNIETAEMRSGYPDSLISTWERLDRKGYSVGTPEQRERILELLSTINEQLAAQGINSLGTETLRGYLLAQGLVQEEIDYLLDVR